MGFELFEAGFRPLDYETQTLIAGSNFYLKLFLISAG
jgi:hypothetical protein